MMGIRSISVSFIGALLLGLPTAWAQPPKGLTARELFYTPPPAAQPAAAQKPKASSAAKAPQQQAAVKKSSPAPKPAKTAPTPVVLASDTQSGVELGGDARLVNTAASSGVPLGLRYSILKYAGDDDYVEVDPDLVFRSGDRIRLSIQVNDTAYLYVVTQGSSGNWRVLFPSPEYDAGSNRVVARRQYNIPGRTRFVFDEQPGTERLFLVLTRRPETDLDKMIYDLDSGAAAPEPTSDAPKKAQPIKTLMAMNSIGDDVVSRIRGQMLARDLVFEKISDDPKTAGKSDHEPEKAVYVVNPNRGDDSRLVVDVSLKHR